jgi:carbamoyltransferase
MKLLGLLNLNQDPAASLMINGKLVSLVEEERFIKNKHAKGFFPQNAINYCLSENGLKLSEIDFITIGWNIFAYESEMKKHFEQTSKQFNKDNKSIQWEINQLDKYNPKQFISKLTKSLLACGYERKAIPPFKFYDHHYTHALSAFIPSKFENAIIITIDGHGEANSTVIWEGRGTKLTKLKEINIPHSLGWFYGAATKFCGFTPNNCEGKTMGLAPYGKPNKSIATKLQKVLSIENYGYKINPQFLFYGNRTYANEFSDSFVTLFGTPRNINDSVFDGDYADFAYEAQATLENIVSHLVKESISKTKIHNICVAGGVALNCKMNGVIASLAEVENIYVQPISNDVGTTLGSSLAVHIEQNKPIHINVMDHTYLGPDYSNDEVEKALENLNFNYKYCSNIEEITAKLLAQGKVVGWFQGKMEAGHRALGNRSILGDPRDPKMKDIINNKVKFREPWRPFCPSILEEYQDKYIENSFYSPYMIIAFKVKPEKLREIPAVVHIDNTARIQSVTKKTNPRYWKLIDEFRKLTNTPVLLNTSFNIKGEPIVCEPADAMNTFKKTKMDYLVMGDYLVSK